MSGKTKTKSQTNYWYAAKENEIFLDLDSRRALRRAVSVLLIAMKKELLPVTSVYLYQTKQRGHFHMILVLWFDAWRRVGSWATKHAWSMWMGNDRLRVAYVLARRDDARIPRGGGDLLVSTRPYFRHANAVCHCKRKHKADSVTERCPAMRALLGKARAADYFARTGERRVRPLKVRIPWGEVSITDLKRWVQR